MPEKDSRPAHILVEDFDDVEWELFSSDREATIGLVPADHEPVLRWRNEVGRPPSPNVKLT